MRAEQMAGVYFIMAIGAVGAMVFWLAEMTWKAWRQHQDARAVPGAFMEKRAELMSLLPLAPLLDRAYAQHDINPHEGLERPFIPDAIPEYSAPPAGLFRPPRFKGDALAGLGECDCEGCRNLRLFKAGA